MLKNLFLSKCQSRVKHGTIPSQGFDVPTPSHNQLNLPDKMSLTLCLASIFPLYRYQEQHFFYYIQNPAKNVRLLSTSGGQTFMSLE